VIEEEDPSSSFVMDPVLKKERIENSYKIAVNMCSISASVIRFVEVLVDPSLDWENERFLKVLVEAKLVR